MQKFTSSELTAYLTKIECDRAKIVVAAMFKVMYGEWPDIGMSQDQINDAISLSDFIPERLDADEINAKHVKRLDELEEVIDACERDLIDAYAAFGKLISILIDCIPRSEAQ